ncbi:hypothetical protein NC651_040186 [Populus alba x Populus x berolinensis]|nr:hypothetical protein NC651_040186 [Populus alba x Populus x berolinensis]
MELRCNVTVTWSLAFSKTFFVSEIGAGIDMIMVPNNSKEFIDDLKSHMKNKVFTIH